MKEKNPNIPKKKKRIPKKVWRATPVPVVDGEKRKAHRPTVYSYKHVEYAEKYLASCVDTERKRIKTEGETSTSWEYWVNVNLPTIEGLCVYFYDNGIWVSRETIYKWKWEEDKKAFSDILEKIMAVQSSRLLKNGLSGDYNPVIAKMMLTKHWYVEKTETELTWKDKQPLFPSLTPEQIKNIGAQMMKWL